MDHIFLSKLVDELAPVLGGKKVRGVVVGREGLAVVLSMPLPRHLVITFSSEVAGFYHGVSPWASSIRKVPRVRKLLVGTQLVSIESVPNDRVLVVRFERMRATGRREIISMVAEWPATRSAIYFVNGAFLEAGIVLEAVGLGQLRLKVGELYRPLPHRPMNVPTLVSEFEQNLERERKVCSSEEIAFRRASGFPPVVTAELLRMVDEEQETIGGAFLRITRMLAVPSHQLCVKREPVFRAGSRYFLLSPIPVFCPEGFKSISTKSFCEAASRGIEFGLRAREIGVIHQRAVTFLKRETGKIERLEKKLAGDSAELPDPSEMRRRAELLLASHQQARRLGGNQVLLPDVFKHERCEIQIPIDPRFSLTANAERYFRLSRKVERSVVRLAKRLDEVQRRSDHLATLAIALEHAQDRYDLELVLSELSGWVEPKHSRKTKLQSLGPRRFKSSRGSEILVGRSGRSNEELTFGMAGPDDLWFHTVDLPGAHVVLRLKGTEYTPDAQDMEEAAAIAAYFSKAQGTSRVEVWVTKRRNLKKIKGAPPGTVRILEGRSVRVQPSLPESGKDPG